MAHQVFEACGVEAVVAVCVVVKREPVGEINIPGIPPSGLRIYELLEAIITVARQTPYYDSDCEDVDADGGVREGTALFYPREGSVMMCLWSFSRICTEVRARNGE